MLAFGRYKLEFLRLRPLENAALRSILLLLKVERKKQPFISMMMRGTLENYDF